LFHFYLGDRIRLGQRGQQRRSGGGVIARARLCLNIDLLQQRNEVNRKTQKFYFHCQNSLSSREYEIS